MRLPSDRTKIYFSLFSLFLMHNAWHCDCQVPEQSSISLYFLYSSCTIHDNARSASTKFHFFLYSLHSSCRMHNNANAKSFFVPPLLINAWLMNALKVTETDSISQMYIRTSVTTFLISSPPPPLAPWSASSLNFFSSEIHSSRVLFWLICFVFSCVGLRRRSEGHTPLYYATENFLVRRKSPQQQRKRNQKFLNIGNDRAKEHKKLWRFVHAI
jgi:hypothetical protein